MLQFARGARPEYDIALPCIEAHHAVTRVPSPPLLRIEPNDALRSVSERTQCRHVRRQPIVTRITENQKHRAASNLSTEFSRELHQDATEVGARVRVEGAVRNKVSIRKCDRHHRIDETKEGHASKVAPRRRQHREEKFACKRDGMGSVTQRNQIGTVHSPPAQLDLDGNSARSRRPTHGPPHVEAPMRRSLRPAAGEMLVSAGQRGRESRPLFAIRFRELAERLPPQMSQAFEAMGPRSALRSIAIALALPRNDSLVIG